ncbi:gibberellin 2-beta-dioxygenase-like [Rutidosis leptorrhynchoides]|uniref:gibberellin 2-beta-dioxygenase-like n=1 Tax=Rutidosis leptorrhynchoides TaxID=125765 RepID=UPI003A9A28A1
MVILSQPQNKPRVKPCTTTITNKTQFTGIPVIDLSCPHDAKNLIVKACQDYGFFKVVNHGVQLWLVSALEKETIRFFNMSQIEKDEYCSPNPLGYGSNNIGPNGDVGWIEYLLITSKDFPTHNKMFSSLAKEYMEAVKKLGCEILELMAEGLKIEPKSLLSRMLSDDKADTVFRFNHYPACPDPYPDPNPNHRSMRNPIGFGEHTDPQLISIARSNTTSGLQICLPDGTWVAVPPDHSSFFINVDDLLQVMTNGRFKSIRHRVIADRMKSRVSMIYFGGPPLMEKISPLCSIMEPGEESLYHEFTWFEYKSCTYRTKLADDRLSLFQKEYYPFRLGSPEGIKPPVAILTSNKRGRPPTAGSHHNFN